MVPWYDPGANQLGGYSMASKFGVDWPAVCQQSSGLSRPTSRAARESSDWRAGADGRSAPGWGSDSLIRRRPGLNRQRRRGRGAARIKVDRNTGPASLVNWLLTAKLLTYLAAKLARGHESEAG